MLFSEISFWRGLVRYNKQIDWQICLRPDWGEHSDEQKKHPAYQQHGAFSLFENAKQERRGFLRKAFYNFPVYHWYPRSSSNETSMRTRGRLWTGSDFKDWSLMATTIVNKKWKTAKLNERITKFILHIISSSKYCALLAFLLSLLWQQINHFGWYKVATQNSMENGCFVSKLHNKIDDLSSDVKYFSL